MQNHRLVTLAGKQLDAQSRRLCAFLHTPEEHRVVRPIIRECLRGGIRQENPFYAAPDEFLRELRSRSAAVAQ